MLHRQINFALLRIFTSTVAALLLCLTTGLTMAAAKPKAAPVAVISDQVLERLKFNNPGLIVDLGVGLWAWPLPMDFDGDGDFDLVVNCPDKPYNGVYFFENASGDTAKNKMPVFKPARRISKAQQNTQVSYLDNKPHVLSPATRYPDFLNTGLEKGEKLPLPVNIHPNKVRANMWRYVDFNGDGSVDLMVGVGDWTEYVWDNAYDTSGHWTNGPLRGFVYYIRNSGTTAAPKYESPTKVMAGDKPVEVFGWPSPNFADFDGDGDLDLLCGEFLDGFTYFENIGTRTAPKYAPGRRLTVAPGVNQPTYPAAWLAIKESANLPGSPRPLTMDLEMITPTAMDWDKDGDLDLIVGDEDGRVAFIENTGSFTADHTPQFLPPRYFQQEADDVKFGALATPFGCDWDGDGDTDIISGNTAGYIAFFENLSGPGVEKPKWAAPKLLEADGKILRIMAGPNGSIQGPCEAKWGYTTLSVADWDGDGLPDLMVNSILGKVVWYHNIGTRKAPKLAAAQPIEVEWDGPQPALAYGWLRPEGKGLLTQWRTTPVAMDWNKDGLIDLVMLDQEGYLAFFERARRNGKLILLSPKRVFCDEKGEPLRLTTGIAGKSGRRKLCIVDWDGDGKLDILLNAANAKFMHQVDARDGKWCFKDMGLLVAQNIEGHDVSPTVVDFNGDGIPDFLGGAEDGRFYYLRNPRTQATEVKRSPVTNGAEWKNGKPVALPNVQKPKVESVLIYQPENAWTYSHHASLTFYKGQFIAIWSNGRTNEDDYGQRVLWSTAKDFAHWTSPRPLVDSVKDDKGIERVLTAAGFHQHQATLVAYFGNYGFHKETTKLQALTTTDGKNWSSVRDIGVPVNPNHGPQATKSGRLIISGNISFPWTDDPTGLTGWHMTGIYPPSMVPTIKDDPDSFWEVAKEQGWSAGLCEGSFYQTDDGILHMLLRNARTKPAPYPFRLWLSQSRDNGATWSTPIETEFSDTNAKFHLGRLPDGRFYYVGNPIGGGRTPLVLSLARDGINFKQHFILGDTHYTQRQPGRWKGGEYGYPHTLIHEGYFYVIVSRQKEGVEVMRVALKDL
jgi:hypothetical protein